MCPSVTPETLLNDKIKRERGGFYEQTQRKKKKQLHIGEG